MPMSSSGSNLLTASVFVTGIGAGLCLDRSIVQLPAFRKTGLQAWLAFSRRADLDNGLFFYPPLVIGGALLSIAAAWSLRQDKGTPPRAAHLAGSAAISFLAAVLAT